MRQLINSTYITLDGAVEGPHLWPPLKAGSSGEGDRIQTDLLETCDIVLMGRRTYDVFAPAWSARSGNPYSDRINTMRKVVVSTTLSDPQWANTEVVAGDVVARVPTCCTALARRPRSSSWTRGSSATGSSWRPTGPDPEGASPQIWPVSQR